MTMALSSSAAPSVPPPPPVEARSLSSITTIAANPPAYPRNPTAKKLDPLVLYIVKVPGSKDIILTPLKPPTKSRVSVEEINASLYYVHVATEDDEAVLETLVERERERERQRERDGFERKPHHHHHHDEIQATSGVDSTFAEQEHARLNHVRRKPVAGLSGSESTSQAGPRPKKPLSGSHEENQRTVSPLASVPTRVPVPQPRQSAFGHAPVVARDQNERDSFDRGVQALRRANTDSDAGGVVARRPLPLLPGSQPQGQPGVVTAHPEKMDKIQHGLSSDNATAPIGRGSLDSSNAQIHAHSSHLPRKSTQAPITRIARPDFQITLIRRDPTHGSQWNVATISSVKDDPGTVDLEIDTPGYGRFAASNDGLSLATLGVHYSFERDSQNTSHKQQAIFAPPPLSDLSSSSPHATASVPKPKPRKFHRQLRVSQPHHNQEASRHVRDWSGGGVHGGSSNLFAKAKYGFGSISMSMSKTGSGIPIPIPYSKLKSGYYTFTSPWNGICTFSTSVNGRSLKCKHLIPNPTAGEGGGGNENTQPATTVAEIRFNTAYPLSGATAGNTVGSVDRGLGSASSLLRRNRNNANMVPPSSTQQQQQQQQQPESATISKSKRASFTAALHNLNLNLKKTAPSSSSFAADDKDHGQGQGQFRRRPRARSNIQSTYSNSSVATAESEDPQPQPEPERKEEYYYDEDDRVDLSLARERAGGGLRGKSAKLGKLIIEDEGIKMLDLVVAACMAVWWRGYQHNTAHP